MNTSFTLVAIDIKAFMTLDQFEERMQVFLDQIKSAEPRDAGAKVSFPGERSFAEMQRRKVSPFPVVGSTYEALRGWAGENPA
jgi:LDH2 family malate/lactate/ureidoglycolate dehydrogenase